MVMVGSDLISPLGADTTDASRFGGKAAGLGRLLDLGHRVPAGLAIRVDALPLAIDALGLGEEYRSLESSMERGEPDLDRASLIHDALLERPVPSELMAAVDQAASRLGSGTLIVRSSAASEDSAAHSYAGIFESIPVSAAEVASGISTVWASVFTPRALTYAAHAGLGRVPQMGVVVQRFIDAERSGVMFTTFPGPDGVDDILVEHVPGTAEKLVRGEVTPSRSWLRSSGNGDGDLAAEHATELSRLAEVLEEQFAGPQDVEWCVIGGEVHVVQTRPVTATAAPPASGDVDEDLVLLRGTPASPGLGSGPVHLAFNVEQALALESGSVLVTTMTNPDMVVAMRNSVGIVTDVGGMICHAAIVSRELQLPCVVGTGSATDALTAGDVVTVDGGHGVVLSGEVVRAVTTGSPASAADLWNLWDETQGDRLPLVSTLELVTTAPAGVTQLAFLVDGDLRCDERGLWQSDVERALPSLLTALGRAPSHLARIELRTAGAVDPAVLSDHVARLDDGRLVVADGAGESDGAPLPSPMVAAAAAGQSARDGLPPIEDSIARSLDPSQGPGPMPRVQPAPMPDPAWRQRWWDRLVEYGRFHREFAAAVGDAPMHPWIEIRSEVLTSPLLKSLVQPGFEMVPRAMELTGTLPMHTKWAKCRFHVRADAFGATWSQLVKGTWDQAFMEHFLRMVRQSYDQLAEVCRLFPEDDAAAQRLDNGQLVALVTAWWPRWVEFFALCLFIQAQGEAILYPVIAETVQANLADCGEPPAGLAWPALPDLVAPTTPVLSGEYMASVGYVRSQLDAAGLTDTAAAVGAFERREPAGLSEAVTEHLRRWHWMRDRDLLFEPWDTAERVIETALRTDPHPPVPYEENRRQNRLALAFHADLAERAGRGELLRHGVRFLQDLNVERENHHVLWLEYSYPLRRVVREMERRLIDAGSHLEEGLAFFLQMPELLDAVEALPQPLPDELGERAMARRRAYRHEAHLEQVDPDALVAEDDYY